jgi:membrane fusion protein, heavy metal efflux system
VTVIVKLTEKIQGIVLPSEAVVRGASNQTIVWIKSGAEKFIAQPVEARTLDAATVVVFKGLAPDNRVVTSGASLINQIR